MSSTCIKRPLRMIATRSATCSTSARTWPGENHSLALRAGFLNQREHDTPCRRVESRSRLVKDQDLHRVGEDLSESEFLLHPGRVCSDPSAEVELHDTLGDGDGAIEADAVAQVREHLQSAVASHRSVHP